MKWPVVFYIIVVASLKFMVRCTPGTGLITTVSSGRLQGVAMAGKGHARNYTAFYGVPYAEPPVGELRYRAPRTPLRWKGIRLADKEGSACPQMDQGQFVGSEDCLYLNVYTPSLDCPSRKLAVMVFLHGGAFIAYSSSAQTYGPDFLVNADVVLVVTNYRLGTFGFLNFNTETIPGNAGLKDMIAALRWVQENIHAFCGDPTRVTLFGQSAGAKAISYLSTSSLSRGLFRAAIDMSGNAMSIMAYVEDNECRCRQLAARLGGNQDDDASVVKTLQTASTEDITRRVFDTFENESGWGLEYNPYVVSRELRPADSEPVILRSDPEFVLSNPSIPRVPTLAGDVSREGVSFAQMLLDSEENLEEMRANFSRFLENEVLRIGSDSAKVYGVPTLPSESRIKEIVQEVRNFYFKGEEISSRFPDSVADFIGDVRYLYPEYFFESQIDRQPAPWYLYLFDVDSTYNIFKQQSYFKMKGAAHADDLAYIFQMRSLGDKQDLEDQSLAGKTLRRYVRLFTDFAKDLKSPLLPPDATRNRNQPPYLYIGKTVEVRRSNTLGEERRLLFWRKITDSLRHRRERLS